jgi:hypothetical protein
MGIKNLINKVVFKFKKKEVFRKVIIETTDALPAAKLEKLLAYLQNNGFNPVTKCLGKGPVSIKVDEKETEEEFAIRIAKREMERTAAKLAQAKKELKEAELIAPAPSPEVQEVQQEEK